MSAFSFSRVLFALTMTHLLALSAHGETTKNKRPNIIMIMVDDLGLYDFSCYGYEAVETPHVDQLAAEGMRFTRAYAAAPVCSPSRAAVITGQAPARLHLTNHISNDHFAPENPRLLDAPCLKALPTETVTFAEKLRDAGYACGFFGKWHLSLSKPDGSRRVMDASTLPDRQGFENNVGGNGNGGPPSWFSPYKNPYLEDGEEGEYLPYRLANEASAYMERNQDRPFLITFWNYLVHSPIKSHPELLKKYRDKKKAGENIYYPVYAGMIEATDRVIGQLLAKVDELGLRDNTVIMVTSDNGGVIKLAYPGNPELRKGKGWLYDGGLRVPLIVRWPGHVKPKSLSDELVSHMDLYPTILEAAQVEPDKGRPLDGESLLPILKGNGGKKQDALFFHYPNYAWHGKNKLGSAVIEGDYKLYHWYNDDSIELYNLRKDAGEKTELSADHPELSSRLKEKLQRWLEEVDANMPVKNENYVSP